MAIVVLRLIRVLRSRELIAEGGRSRVVKVQQQTSPVSFWVEIGLHVAAAVFLFVYGLLLTNLAPAWLEDPLSSE